MATLRIDEDIFDREREVVKEERRMRDREPAVRPAERDHLRPGVHGASLQAPDDRQHEGPEAASIDDVRDFYRTYYVPYNATVADRRRLRHRAGHRPGEPVPRPDPEGAEAGAARHPARAAADRPRARRVGGDLAAAGGGRRRTTSPTTGIPTRIRCTWRRRSCPTGRVRASTASWSTRTGLALAAFGRRQPRSSTRTCSTPSPSCSPGHTAGRGREGADRRARPAEDEPDHGARTAAREEPVRPRLHPRPRDDPAEGHASSRTPRCCTTRHRTADGEFDIFQNITGADVQRVAQDLLHAREPAGDSRHAEGPGAGHAAGG